MVSTTHCAASMSGTVSPFLTAFQVAAMLLLCMFIRPHLHGTCRWTARQVRRKGNRQPYVVCNSIHETLCWFLALRQAKLSPQEANIMHFMTLRSLTHPVLHRVVWKTSRTAPVSSTMQMSGALPCKSSSASICTPVDLTGVQSSSRSFPCTTRSWCPPACNEGWYSDVYTIRLDSLHTVQLTFARPTLTG